MRRFIDRQIFSYQDDTKLLLNGKIYAQGHLLFDEFLFTAEASFFGEEKHSVFAGSLLGKVVLQQKFSAKSLQLFQPR